MDRCDHGGALTDRAPYALYRPRTHVADGKDSGHARRERHRHAVRHGAIVAGHHKAVAVALDAASAQPTSLGIGSDEHEHMANGPGGFGVRLFVAPGDGRKT